jgi:predicted DNA-binding transcriptional regulator AlpA
MDAAPQLISRAEGLKLLGASRQTAWRRRRDAAWPQPFAIGGRLFYSKQRLHAWIAAKAAGEVPPTLAPPKPAQRPRHAQATPQDEAQQVFRYV